MGTGVNVQLRLKALHHLDVPWLPSQIEQREGRIERQGNQHDEIEIYAYATLGSHGRDDVAEQRAQGAVHRAALSGDRSVRRLEDVGEPGQPVRDRQGDRLGRRRPDAEGRTGERDRPARTAARRAYRRPAAIRRQIRDAEHDIDLGTRRIGEIGKDIERRKATAAEAFAASVKGAAFMERKEAGRALMKEILTLVQVQQEEEIVVASIGEFDLVFQGERFGREGYRYTTMLVRTGASSRSSSPLRSRRWAQSPASNTRFPTSRANRRHTERLNDARRRLDTYGARVGEAFAFDAELGLKRAELAKISRSILPMAAIAPTMPG